MTVLDSSREATDGSRALEDATELLIPEARRRQRRRWLRLGAAVTALAALAIVVALVSDGFSSKPGPSTTGTLSSPVIAKVHCAPSGLSVRVGEIQGSMEHWLLQLIFTNVSATSCSVTRYPTASFVNATGQIVGLTIATYRLADGKIGSLVLKHGESVSSIISQFDTTDLVKMAPCSPVPWVAIRITSPAKAVVEAPAGQPEVTSTCTTGQAATGQAASFDNPLDVIGPYSARPRSSSHSA